MDSNTVHIINDQQPHDIIIRHIRMQLQSGEMRPGMRLPAERKMAEEYGISRTYVRAALKSLESYGIVETRPQSGTFIVGLDVKALDGLFADVLKLDALDFASLAEMRAILEVNAVRFCAERRSEKDLEDIKAALDNYEDAFKKGDQKKIYSTDFEFHRCIAAGSGNTTLRSMLMLITPDIMNIYQSQNICSPLDSKPLEEHRLMYQFILHQQAEVAAQMMKEHLNGMLKYAETLRKK